MEKMEMCTGGAFNLIPPVPSTVQPWVDAGGAQPVC